MRPGLAIVGLLFSALLLPADAAAHRKSVSYSNWSVLDGSAVAQARVSWVDLTSIPDATPEAAAPYLQQHLILQTNAGPCVAVEGSETALPAERGWLRLEWQVQCPDDPTALESRLFSSLANHVHLATVTRAVPETNPDRDSDGNAVQDLVISSTSPRAALRDDPDASRAAGLGGYVVLGVEHILTGWDHLAFLVLLIVIASRLREVVLLVTGFTVGHSITLAGASLGAIVPHPAAVEAIIAASILVVALENGSAERTPLGRIAVGGALVLFVACASVGGLPAFWGLALFTLCYFLLLRVVTGAGRLRWAIACLFGFVHGLGFSGVLLEQALPRAELVRALFGFNVGVELGQLALVALVWPLLQWLRRRELGPAVVEATSFAGAALGTFALVARVFGPS